ncbi:MAG: DUF1566 domain-containing protein [Candidatus Electrothrix sp. EH2]|nr:DUF1566 domain-containing protein [Candidatus Electrothrix sp. EH2]
MRFPHIAEQRSKEVWRKPVVEKNERSGSKTGKKNKLPWVVAFVPFVIGVAVYFSGNSHQKTPVSPPVVPSPKEEPAQPFIIVDHPRKKKVVVNTGQTHTEDTLEQPAASQPKQGDPMTDPIIDMEFVTAAKVLKRKKDRRIGRYIDHGDGTVTDTKTVLMWKRCSEGLSGNNCEEGKAGEYTWNEAVRRFKNVQYAGYADWRLPSIDELKTLVQCSKGMNEEKGWCNEGANKPTINQQAFPNTEADWFWSKSPYADYSGRGWSVNFGSGESGVAIRLGGGFAVRLVRDGQ